MNTAKAAHIVQRKKLSDSPMRSFVGKRRLGIAEVKRRTGATVAVAR